jgi:hypothetical protein
MIGKTLELEEIRFAITRRMDLRRIPNTQINVALDHMADEMVACMTRRIAAFPQQVQTDHSTVRVPATWFDHWKHEHPRLTRFLRLTAPKFRTIERKLSVTGRFVLPDFELPDSCGRPVLLLEVPQVSDFERVPW